MRLAALISSGKDSLFAISKAIQQGHSVDVLIAIESKNPESYMFHVPNIRITKLMAEAMQIPILYRKTRGIKEEELEDLKKAIAEAKKKYGVEGVVSGALYSKYQKSRIENICRELELKCLAPLWHIDQESHLNHLIKNKFEFIITAVCAEGLNESWLGKEINKISVEEFKQLAKKYGFSPVGEGGEAESLVLDCPLFRKKIKVLKAKKIMTGEFSGYFKIEKAMLVEKV